MDNEFDIVPGVQTPLCRSSQELLASRINRREAGVPQCRDKLAGSVNPVAPALEAQDELMTSINNVYCNSSNSSVNANDIALTFQEVNSVNFSGLISNSGNNGSYGNVVPESISKFHQLRKQSDLAMIRSVQEDDSHHQYFTKPPLHTATLFFSDASIEKDYRLTAWKANHSLNTEYEENTLASSAFNAYFDILVSGVVFLVMCFSCFVQYEASQVWLAVCFIAGAYHLLVVLVCVKQMVSPAGNRSTFNKMYNWCRGWYPSQFFGALLICLPVTCLLSNLTCDNFGVLEDSKRNYFLNLLTIAIIHFCNFTQLYCWIKSILVTLFGGSIILFLAVPVCPCDQDDTTNSSALYNATAGIDSGTRCGTLYSHFLGELILIITMLLVLVWLLNREFEISYRLSFHCSLLAARDRKKILNLKNQADWLLHNIIPKHVSEQLKKSAKYSENHKDVGIIFATLVNFNELYDESYMGGKEYLRVLNELISDFDELLDRPEFNNVEKIKTIGATFMAASGLNPLVREENQHKYQHVMELMEFAFQLQKVVEDFNQSLIEFDLILRIGINFGDVTSGVIGTTKLYYDIWGDAVNIASRMDSTGVNGKIQVNERSKDILKQWYEFDERGKIFVKGKDNMNVYLFTRKKESAYRMF